MYIVTSSCLRNADIGSNASSYINSRPSSLSVTFNNTPGKTISELSNYSQNIVAQRFLIGYNCGENTQRCKDAAFLLDNNMWEFLINENIGYQAVGTIPIDMMVKSWNAKYPSNFSRV